MRKLNFQVIARPRPRLRFLFALLIFILLFKARRPIINNRHTELQVRKLITIEAFLLIWLLNDKLILFDDEVACGLYHLQVVVAARFTHGWRQERLTYLHFC